MNLANGLGLLFCGLIATVGIFYLLLIFEEQTEKDRKEKDNS